mmetsp:Transcript_38704/g.102842  ORF Transcript_38704/g.102842 Transcript_38704/m.102842 type:complete len:89 (+) Transcript_38704:216-482(+)
MVLNQNLPRSQIGGLSSEDAVAPVVMDDFLFVDVEEQYTLESRDPLMDPLLAANGDNCLDMLNEMCGGRLAGVSWGTTTSLGEHFVET